MFDQQRIRPACLYAQSDQSLCYSLEYSMTVKLLTKHHLEFLSLTGGCTGSSESTHVRMPNCLKSYATDHFIYSRVSSISKVGSKLGKMSQNLSSAAVVTGALRVKGQGDTEEDIYTRLAAEELIYSTRHGLLTK